MERSRLRMQSTFFILLKYDVSLFCGKAIEKFYNYF